MAITLNALAIFGTLLGPAAFATLGLAAAISSDSDKARCLSLPSTLSIPDTSVKATWVQANSTIALTATGCPNSVPATFDTAYSFCRIESHTTTSNTSRVLAETWLPPASSYNNRLLATGNGGLGGCFIYPSLLRGISAGFASVNTDNGHAGEDIEIALNKPEITIDFAWRALQVEHTVGTALAEAYYSQQLSRKYYAGCSTGGRQGIWLAQNRPGWYDGILAGAPAMDQLRLSAQLVRVGLATGAHSDGPDEGLLAATDLALVTKGVLDACDGLDGVVDGAIDEPAECKYKATSQACTAAQTASGKNTTGLCLTPRQVKAIDTLFSPLLDEQGRELYPRFDPGMTDSHPPYVIGNGVGWSLARSTWRYMIYNDTSYSLDNFTLADLRAAERINPGGISTFNPDLSALKKAGTKMISYHGTADGIIPSGITLNYYDMVTAAIGAPQSFYRHFQIPGMEHCSGGPEIADNIGQSFVVLPVHDAKHDAITALMQWVEQGKAPDTLIGTKWVDDDPTKEVLRQRTYCPLPKRSVLKKGADKNKAASWKCV